MGRSVVSHTPPRRTTLIRDWVILASVAAVLLVAVWGFGGFRPATATGRPVAPGEEIELNRWQLSVLSASYSDQALRGYEIDPVIRVDLRAVNLDDATQLAPTPKMITVRVDGQVLTDDQLGTTSQRSFNYDPDVPARLVYEYSWPPEDAPGRVDPPREITVIIRDERETQNFVYDENLVAGDAVASVRLPCPDDREKK